MFATDSRGNIILARFEPASLQGVYLRNILADRSEAVAEWNRNLRLQAMPTIEPSAVFEPAPDDGRDIVTVADKLEAVYRRYRFERWQVSSVMANDPDNEGRGSSLQAPQTVNATETRHSERWQSSDRSVCFENQDWQCYSIDPRTGAKTAFEPNRSDGKASRSKPRRIAHGKAMSHRAIVAKLGIVAYDEDEYVTADHGEAFEDDGSR